MNRGGATMSTPQHGELDQFLIPILGRGGELYLLWEKMILVSPKLTQLWIQSATKNNIATEYIGSIVYNVTSAQHNHTEMKMTKPTSSPDSEISYMINYNPQTVHGKLHTINET